MKTIRVGNASGFWGDNVDAPLRLVETGNLDYLTLEYLAELTMSILALQKAKNPDHGYARDFVEVMQRLAPRLDEQPHLKIVTNAGGMNPHACARAVKKVLHRDDVPIAVVTGDDIFPRLTELLDQGHTLRNIETGRDLHEIIERVVSANVYLGAEALAAALRQGARLVITGRVADASLVVGPCLAEFGWNLDQYDQLCGATVAGHLIECGAQVTGGLWSNADDQLDLGRIGYPIALIDESGNGTITKPQGSGGVVNLETVTEQLLYEVADPSRYYTPDVVADFTSISLTDLGQDQVAYGGARASQAPDQFKVSLAYRDGYMCAGTLVIYGPHARKRAESSGKIILEKLRHAGITFDRYNLETLGAGSVVPGSALSEPPEVVLRVAVHDASQAKVERFAREFAPLVTSGYAGTTGYTTGRPAVREVFAYWPALLDRRAVNPSFTFLD